MDAEHANESGKHARTHSQITVRSGSSKHSNLQPEAIDWDGSTDDLKIHPENDNGGESNVNFEMQPEITHGKQSTNPFEMHLEVFDGSGSSRHSSQPHAAINEGDTLFPAKKLCSSSSSSSSSSALSLDDLLQVNAKEASMHKACTIFCPRPDKDNCPALQDVETDFFNKNSSKLAENDNGFPDSISMPQVSDATQESTAPGLPTTQSPPVQVMERPGEYNSERIPSSIFGSTSTTPMDWSIASNESLFSIHVGNNSFSRDRFSGLGDLGKSGELLKSGELFTLPSPPAISTVETEKEHPVPALESERNNTEEDKSEATEVTLETKAKTEDLSKEKTPPPVMPRNPSSISKNSDESGNSSQSFAFPIKKKKKCTWTTCYCSNCNWAFCYCRWAGCNFTWPSCNRSNCNWAFQCSWNCSYKRTCHSPPILADGVRTNSKKPQVEEKPRVEEQRLQQRASQGTSKSSSCSWFSCCFCNPRSCFRCRNRCC